VVIRATEDLMTAQFGMASYDVTQLGQVFDLLRGLRVAAGDFAPGPPDGQ
jgi:hypothetical protein